MERKEATVFILREINQNPYPWLGLHGGYITFTVSIITIGMITAVIGDVASHLGCFIFLKDTVNAIAFVALGTSVPGNCETVFSRDWQPENKRFFIRSFYTVFSFFYVCNLFRCMYM